jgi:GntR family transcriptional repressor for pyruvate dehydrogenase complex
LSDKQTYEPIARRKTYELVADQLIAQISSRTLSPGDVLPPERELVEAYGVGRSSVREALRMLESRGLISSRGNGAFTVAEWRNPLNQSLGLLIAAAEGDLHDLFEVRRILEGGAAALAAARRTEEHLAALHAAVADMEENLGDEGRYIDADVSFHLTVAEATGNRVALHLMHAIRNQLQDAFGTVYHIPGSPERSLAQHREIAGAIALRRPDEARERMHEHIGRVENEIDRSAVPPRVD